MVRGIFNVAAIFLVLPTVLQNTISVACNSRISQANFHAVLNFVHTKNCIHGITDIETFAGQNCTIPVVQNQLSLLELTFLAVIKGSLLAFVNTIQRLADYLSKQLQKLLEPFLANCLKLMQYRKQFLPNFTDFAKKLPASTVSLRNAVSLRNIWICCIDVQTFCRICSDLYCSVSLSIANLLYDYTRTSVSFAK